MATSTDHTSTVESPQNMGATHLSAEIVSMALRIRAFEELLLELYGLGNIRGTVHTCLGQELLACVVSSFLQPTDRVFGTHRGHGYFLSLTSDFAGLGREILGRHAATSLGIGGSQHLHADNILTNGVQGGLVPVATGAACALDEGISVAVFGDGTLGQGILYESLNIAALQAAPTLYLLEDNGIAQTTPQEQTVAGSIQLRFEAFGVPYFAANDNDPIELAAMVERSITHVRESREPAALHVRTKRLGPHSKGDDNRPRDHVQELQQSDYLTRVLASSPEVLQEFERSKADLRRTLSEIVSEPPAVEVPRYDHARSVLQDARISNGPDRQSGVRIRQQLTSALGHALRSNQRTWLIGEDVEHLPPGMERPYSGAFGVSDDLSQRFPGQVRNFPISEAAIAGFGIGRALAGSPTIAEIMFGDFSTLTLDQLRQQASKMVGVYRNPSPLPFILRTPMGGRRGYGPTHSQSLEGLFLGIPNITVCCLSPFGISETFVDDLLQLEIPAVLIENKDLYPLMSRTDIFSTYQIHWPTSALDPVSVRPAKHRPDATIVTYGFAAELTLRSLESLARKYEIFVDVLCYEFLSPLNATPVHESLTQTHKLALVEEGLPEMGLGSTLLSALAKEARHQSFAATVLGAKGDIGASEFAETDSLINEERIIECIVKLVKEPAK